MASPKNGIVVSIETATPLWALLSVSDIMISIVTVCLMTPRSDELRTNLRSTSHGRQEWRARAGDSCERGRMAERAPVQWQATVSQYQAIAFAGSDRSPVVCQAEDQAL